MGTGLDNIQGVLLQYQALKKKIRVFHCGYITEPSVSDNNNYYFKITDQEFLDSMEVSQSYWYKQASSDQQQRINNLLLNYRDTFTNEKQKVGRCDIDGDFKSC